MLAILLQIEIYVEAKNMLFAEVNKILLHNYKRT